MGYFNSPPSIEDSITCDRCGMRIYIGDEFYDVDGSNLCEECFDDITRKWRRIHGD